jgi:hypothetical protein
VLEVRGYSASRFNSRHTHRLCGRSHDVLHSMCYSSGEAMKTFTQIGTGIGELVQEKNTAYGSSFAVAGNFLRLLFPAGVPPDRFDDALLMVRIFDKQMRIATDKDAFGESPYADIAGYGILGVQLHQQRKDSATWQGSAKGPDAKQTQKAQPASADQLTSATTTTNASATIASEPSPQPVSSFARRKADATAPTVTVVANANAVARRSNLAHSYERWNYRHNVLQCAACELEARGDDCKFIRVRSTLGVICLRVCSAECWEFCSQQMGHGSVEGATTP